MFTNVLCMFTTVTSLSRDSKFAKPVFCIFPTIQRNPFDTCPFALIRELL